MNCCEEMLGIQLWGIWPEFHMEVWDSSAGSIDVWALYQLQLDFVVWFFQIFYQQILFWQKGIILAFKVNGMFLCYELAIFLKNISIFIVQKWFYFFIQTKLILLKFHFQNIIFPNAVNIFNICYFNLEFFRNQCCNNLIQRDPKVVWLLLIDSKDWRLITQ